MNNQNEIYSEVKTGTCAICFADNVQIETVEVPEHDSVDVCECCKCQDEAEELLDLDMSDEELFNINTWN